jgi:hypothetical protein
MGGFMSKEIKSRLAQFLIGIAIGILIGGIIYTNFNPLVGLGSIVFTMGLGFYLDFQVIGDQ